MKKKRTHRLDRLVRLFSKRNQKFSFVAKEKERIPRAAITNGSNPSIHRPSTIDHRPSSNYAKNPSFPPFALAVRINRCFTLESHPNSAQKSPMTCECSAIALPRI